MLCYVMLTFKLVEITSKVQEQLVFQKNQAACDKSSEQGLRLCLQLPFCWQYLVTKKKAPATKAKYKVCRRQSKPVHSARVRHCIMAIQV